MPYDAVKEEDDEVLLDRFARGDQAAARALAVRHTPRVLAVATRMLKDRTEAEDVAQEAMLRLWKIAPEWRQGEAKVSTWAYRVTANLCTDRLRQRKRLVPLEVAGDPASGGPSADVPQGSYQYHAPSRRPRCNGGRDGNR